MTKTASGHTEPMELPPGFNEEFARGLSEYDPAMVYRMSETVIKSKAIALYNKLRDHMDESEFVLLTAQEFGNLVAAGMAIAELDSAGIEVANLKSDHDVKRAVRSRDFKRHLRTKQKIARKRIKEIDQKRREDDRAIEEIKSRISKNEKIIRESELNIDSKDKELSQLTRKIEAAKNDRPKQLAEELQIARDELENIHSNTAE